MITYSGNVWRIAKIKIIGEIMFSKWIDFGHKDTIYKLKFGWLKFGKSWLTRQFSQTFLLSNIPAIQYIVQKTQNDRVRLIISLWKIQLGF